MPARPKVRRHSPAPSSDSLRGLGERIRKARVGAGLSQAQLGAPHFTRAYVSALELGKVRPAMASLEFLAGKLGKPVTFFVEDEQKERERQERELDIRSAASLLTRATAADALKKIGPLLEGATSPREIARLRLMAGTAHNYLIQGTPALRELTAAERAGVQLGDDALIRSVRHQLAIAYRSIGEITRARDLLIAILKELDQQPGRDQAFRMKLLRDLGAASWDLGEYERAAAYYESALECADHVGDVAGLVAIYNGLAYTRRSLGDLEGATTYLQRALGASQVSNDLWSAAHLYNALAVIAAERGHLEAANAHADRAIEIARVNGPAAYVAHYVNTKAECALKLDRLDDAERLAREALASAVEHDNQRAAAAAHVVLGEVCRRTGKHEDATDRLREAAGLYRDLGMKNECADVLMRLSALFKGLGDLTRAQATAEEAYELTKAPNTLMGS